MMRRGNMISAIGLLAAGVLGLEASVADSANAQAVDPNLWVTDGDVYATVPDGNTLYIGGHFSRVGPNIGSFAAIDALNGEPRSGWPRVDGSVLAVVADGAGGWYIGGAFTHVSGVA